MIVPISSMWLKLYPAFSRSMDDRDHVFYVWYGMQWTTWLPQAYRLLGFLSILLKWQHFIPLFVVSNISIGQVRGPLMCVRVNYVNSIAAYSIWTQPIKLYQSEELAKAAWLRGTALHTSMVQRASIDHKTSLASICLLQHAWRLLAVVNVLLVANKGQ